VALLTVAGLTEGVSILSLLPLIDLSMLKGGESPSRAGQWLSQAIGAVGLKPSLGTWLFVIVAGIALKAGITLVAMKEVGFAVGRLMTDLRRRLVMALMEARWSYYVSQPLGVFANTLGAETMRAGATYQQAARLASAFTQGMMYTVLTFLVSWRTALLALLAGAAAVVIFRKVVTGAQVAGSHQTELMRSLSVRVTDTLQGIKAVKAMAAEELALPLIDREISNLDANQKQQVWLIELLRAGQEPILVTALAIGLYGALQVGGVSLSELMVVAVLFYRLLNRFQAVQEIYQAMALSESAYWSMYEMVNNLISVSEDIMSGGVQAPSTPPRLTLQSVGYAYGEKQVLCEASLDISAGEFVVLLGSSGAGKTTLLDLMGGLLQPSSGGIKVDGIDLSSLDLRSWRRRIGYVPQEMLLLHDSVYRNVSLGDQTITRSDVEQALQAAGVWSEVAALPKGIDAPMGERGAHFSGGQRQRISLARALVRQPSILLLDEITAALDEQAERGVCETLRTLAGKMTIVAVSHQRIMARVADRCVQLEDGRLTVAVRSVDLVVANAS